MRKITAILLTLAMLLTLASCGRGEAAGVRTKIIPEFNGSDWCFAMVLENSGDEEATIVGLVIFDRLGSEIFSEHGVAEDNLDRIGLGGVTLAPGEKFEWTDGCPYSTEFDEREYRFILRIGKKETECCFLFDLSTASVGDGGQSPHGDWRFDINIENPFDEPASVVGLRIVDTSGEQINGEFGFVESEMGNLGLADVILAPGETLYWCDWHPVVSEFDGREYIFTIRSESGDEGEQHFFFDLNELEPIFPDDNQQPSGDWSFNIHLENTTDEPITLVELAIIDSLNGEPINEPTVFAEADLGNLGLGGLTLAPGDTQQWGDGHPVVDFFDEREYIFTFRTDSGEDYVLSFPFDLTEMTDSMAPIDYSGDEGKDLLTLRHDAKFEQNVAQGVYWVPANVLGESSMTNVEIHAMLPLSPEEKQAEISTLYEALQLYQVGNFYASDDNIRIHEGGYAWEHHKPGYHAVRTNTGCCATDSNWLNYILRGDYDEVGYIATSQRDGSGHIFNYILHEGRYYIVDLTHYRTDWIATAPETGDMNDYYSTDFIAGNIHAVSSIDSFVDYMQSTYNDPPGLMFMYTAENCLAIDSVNDGGTVITIVYEKAPGVNVNVIFDDPGDSLDYKFVTPPTELPDWDSQPGFTF